MRERSPCSLLTPSFFWCFTRRKRPSRWRLLPSSLLLLKRWDCRLWICWCVCLSRCQVSQSHSQETCLHTLQRFVLQSTDSMAFTDICRAYDLINAHWHFNCNSNCRPFGNSVLHQSRAHTHKHTVSPLSTCTRLTSDSLYTDALKCVIWHYSTLLSCKSSRWYDYKIPLPIPHLLSHSLFHLTWDVSFSSTSSSSSCAQFVNQRVHFRRRITSVWPTSPRAEV